VGSDVLEPIPYHYAAIAKLLLKYAEDEWRDAEKVRIFFCLVPVNWAYFETPENVRTFFF